MNNNLLHPVGMTKERYLENKSAGNFQYQMYSYLIWEPVESQGVITDYQCCAVAYTKADAVGVCLATENLEHITNLYGVVVWGEVKTPAVLEVL